VAAGEYPTLSLSDRGRKVIKREEDPNVVWPTPGGDRAPGAAAILDESDMDLDLLEALRSWRNEEARCRGVPPYMVLADKSLREVACIKPSSGEELAQVWGMGAYKIENFGPGILEVVLSRSPGPRA